MVGGQDSWIEDEPRLSRLARQVLRRSLRRPLRTVAVALLLTLYVVTSRVRQSPGFRATLYFRLAEGDFNDPTNAPRPPRVIRDYIASVALSQHELTRIMTKMGIYRTLMKTDPVLAVSLLREDIDIGVARNYFIFDSGDVEGPRSAQISISFRTGNRDVAVSVVHALGDAVLREQATRRKVHFENARTASVAAVQHSRDAVKRLQGEMDGLSVQAARADAIQAIGIRAQIAALYEQMKGALGQTQQLEHRLADLEFASQVEQNRLGLNFELVDEEVETWAPPLVGRQLVRYSVAAFVAFLALSTVFLGGLDRRIYTPEDLAAQGVPILGALARFSGDDIGSLADRTRRRRSGGLP